MNTLKVRIDNYILEILKRDWLSEVISTPTITSMGSVA